MTAWHVNDNVLARYASSPESIDHSTASSVEMHVLECAVCRAKVAAATDDDVVARSWSEISDRIDAPRDRAALRWLRVVGLDDRHARLVAATPALRLSALAGVLAITGGLLWLSIANDDAGPFLVLAPVLPLAAVAAAFWPGADPAGETGRAAPLAGFGLVLRRAVVLLVPCIVIVAIASLAVPGSGLTDAAWVLPSLALATGALALSTWLRTEVALGVMAGAWFIVLAVTASREHVAIPDVAPLQPSGQLVWLVLAVVAGAVTVARRDVFTVPTELP